MKGRLNGINLIWLRDYRVVKEGLADDRQILLNIVECGCKLSLESIKHRFVAAGITCSNL